MRTENNSQPKGCCGSLLDSMGRRQGGGGYWKPVNSQISMRAERCRQAGFHDVTHVPHRFFTQLLPDSTRTTVRNKAEAASVCGTRGALAWTREGTRSVANKRSRSGFAQSANLIFFCFVYHHLIVLIVLSTFSGPATDVALP